MDLGSFFKTQPKKHQPNPTHVKLKISDAIQPITFQTQPNPRKLGYMTTQANPSLVKFNQTHALKFVKNVFDRKQ